MDLICFPAGGNPREGTKHVPKNSSAAPLRAWHSSAPEGLKVAEMSPLPKGGLSENKSSLGPGLRAPADTGDLEFC